MQRRVLIADDNQAVRKTLHQLLVGLGCEVTDAEDGHSALSQALKFRPDIVILDLAMPVMDGLSAAREISSALPDTVILMYTMHWTPQLELESKKCGVQTLVPKAHSTILLAAVQQILNAKESESPHPKVEPISPQVPSTSTLPLQIAGHSPSPQDGTAPGDGGSDGQSRDGAYSKRAPVDPEDLDSDREEPLAG